MAEYAIRPLSPDTWADFAGLAERHNGCRCAAHGSCWTGGDGCWCIRFQRSCAPKQPGEHNRDRKERLVSEGRAHAALVFDGAAAVAWCQYGRPEELPDIYHRREYEAGADRLPDYRLTCLFVDKSCRRRGIGAAALRGALDLIAQAGGGVVEAYPQDTDGQTISASFLYNGTRSLFAQAGFSYDRPKGTYHCVMSTTVPRA
ncbi:MAG TPA: GNAT family N-acetyltransferase [Streptosporangiaceae bacterium]|jgi:GNAT superfamily N-acetyltransferase